MSEPLLPAVQLTRSAVRLVPNAARVLATRFMPGEELPDDHSRASAVIARVMRLSDAQVTGTLEDLDLRFTGRHRDLRATFLRNFEAVAPRLGGASEPSDDRRMLIGAYFTHEESPEAAALTNPSIVAHPDQSGLGPGDLRFILSLRAIGEGHVSCIEFRTGVVSGHHEVSIDKPAGPLVKGRTQPGRYDRESFRAQLSGLGALGETSLRILDRLGSRFSKAMLDEALADLDPQIMQRNAAREMVERFAWVAANNYEVRFPPDSAIDERILVPTGPSETNGIEDARFVRFVDDDGSVTYHATYTAYDGRQVAPQLLSTRDFVRFQAHQLSGPSARNKGMALFPRRVGGRYWALSRWDRESNSVATSHDLWTWEAARTFQVPQHPWDLIQIGNCGSPIETASGWLVITHGVGPMRTYALGATLLDIDDPSRMIASLPEPLLTAGPDEREGYVPNVVYTCGALVHGDALVLPYGYGDQAIAFAVVDLPSLLNRLGAGG